MSVPLGDQDKSPMQFIDTADTIEEKAMEVCKKWPKSYMFIITQRTIALASAIYEHAQAANAIIPQTERERGDRISELQKALGANYAFAKKIERAYKLFPICGTKDGRSEAEEHKKSNNLFQEFMSLCTDEEEALKGNIHYTRSVNLNKLKQNKKPGEPG